MEKNNALYLAEESTYKIAKTLVDVYHHPSTTAEAKDDIVAGANLISKTINALHSENTTKNIADITDDLEKHKDNQEHSGLLAKIKEFIKSIISLLTSSFNTRSAEEVRKSTDDTIREIVASKDDKEDQKYTSLKSTSSLPSIANHSSSQATTEPRARSASVSSAPPSPPSPPPLIRVHTFPIEGDRKALMAAIREGTQLKNVAERKSLDSTRTILQDSQTSVIDELTKRLKARREKFGDSHEIVAPASKFTEDAKLFEQARREEAERQARIEQSENIRVAEAKAAEKKDKSLEIKSSPKPINLKPGEIPPPPPLPSTPSSPQANNQVKYPLQTTKVSNKNRAKSLQMQVTQKEIEEARQKLGKRTLAVDNSRQEVDTAHINFQSILKKKRKLGPNKGYNK